MVRRVFTTFLVLWLSGVAFLFCCLNMKAEEAIQASCPLAKIAHCENSRRQETVNSLQRSSLGFDCCSPFIKLFDKTRKEEKSQNNTLEPSLERVSFFLRHEQSKQEVKSNRLCLCPPVPQEKLHIKNRVLRI
ncbi:MAG: hypothetical protein NZM17_03455 [Pyrinomonadaceae bacterium]|nr:hypothetical protein [Pyrinomonadaceae bacterium]